MLACASGCGRPADSGPAEVPTLRQTTARIRGFDPAQASDQASIQAVGKIYEGLLQYSYWDRPYRVEPLLAAAWPEVSAAGLVWRFRLRPGIFFADDPCFAATGGQGREVVAQDVVYSFLRIADTKVGSSGYWIFRGKIEGLDDFRESSRGDAPTDYARPVAGLRLQPQLVRRRPEAVVETDEAPVRRVAPHRQHLGTGQLDESHRRFPLHDVLRVNSGLKSSPVNQQLAAIICVDL